MWLNNTGVCVGLIPYRRTLGTLFLLIVTPIVPVLLWWVIQRQDGDLARVAGVFAAEGGRGVMAFVREVPSPVDVRAWQIIGCFIGLALGLTRLIPCKMYKGPPSPTGYRNTYHANGVEYFLLMNALFVGGSQFGLGLYNGGILYDHYGEILSALTVFALLFCLMLYVKGITFPSSKDSGTTDNPMFDFFYGTELYPNILGWDVKQFTNDRFGLTWWAIACLSFACKQYETFGYVSDAMLISVCLQWIYLLKFFVWETGYFCTMDIQHDRAGYYICWGCMVWVPSVYTSSAHWCVMHPITIGIPLTAMCLFLGAFFIWVNYDSDRQRQVFRATSGEAMVWGRKPQMIVATYRTEAGELKQSLLLASGWWGLARHFHYLPEILAALMWAPPVTLSYILPYFYTVYLTILLLDRAYRDDARCASKYGKDWAKYQEKVPYRIVPFVL